MRRAVTLRDGGPLIVAHRGAWDPKAPQNSIAALEAAIELGCDMVEVDVRRTRDGKLVAVHDSRIAGSAVAALDHDQVLARVAPGQAQPLEAILERAVGRITLDIDLKEGGWAAGLSAALARHLTPDGYVVTSFMPAALAEIRQHSPPTRTGLLLRPVQLPGLQRRLLASGADFIAPHASVARAAILAWAAARGLESYVWTVNDTRALRAAVADPRVTAVITDRPARALALRAGASRQTAA
jgi:glycerophosphoryl diester phosphodiesterase